MNKFKKDDIVERCGDRGKVLKVLNNGKYLILDLRSNLDYVVDENDLKFWTKDLQFNSPKDMDYGATCPQCSKPWTISGFGATKWYDCKTCNKRAEDLVFLAACEEEPEDNFGNTIDPYDLEYLMKQIGNFRP